MDKVVINTSTRETKTVTLSVSESNELKARWAEDALTVPKLKTILIEQTKEKAFGIIDAIAPAWKQQNVMRDFVKYTNENNQVQLDIITMFWQTIDDVRTKSNILEAYINNQITLDALQQININDPLNW